MKRWTWGWIFIGVVALLVVISRAGDAELLKDSDTVLILNAIKARGAPLSWFGGDWPLGNHFYRPIVSLLFELDLAVHGNNAAGFGLTNAILAALCVVSLYWFIREVTDSFAMSCVGGGLFGLWILVGKADFLGQLGYLVAALGLISLVLPGRPRWIPFLTFCSGLALVYELRCFAPFRHGIVEWLPGRTASCATLFCLIAMAAYARSVRIGSSVSEMDRGPLDPPATRGTTAVRGGTPMPWLILTVVAAVLALGSYEQAVMLPALLMVVAMGFALKRYRIDWRPHIVLWSLLIAYLVLRFNVVPPGTSGYQEQQMRLGEGVFLTICDYAFPSAREIVVLLGSLELGAGTVLLTQGLTVIAVVANVGLWWGLVGWVRRAISRADRSILVALFVGFVGSLLAFLPMAFLKPFGTLNHYHFLALALRATFVAALLVITGEWLICGLSPRAIQAPKRLAPAPGSLPHR